ncbi:MAG: hypothetical protein FJX76_23335 [Armatimonadetes bacterium]|nr:hypothetical protein [Armatimonadota bacterium]
MRCLLLLLIVVTARPAFADAPTALPEPLMFRARNADGMAAIFREGSQDRPAMVLVTPASFSAGALSVSPAFRVTVHRGHDDAPGACAAGVDAEPRVTVGERRRSVWKRMVFEVLTHRQVPPNDGGISLGQAANAGNY